MKKSLAFLDEVIEKAEYDSHVESKKCGMIFENFYLFNLKILKELIKEESGFSNEK